MDPFEYLAVFVSIIFGISVTHVMAGVMRSFYRGERDTTRLIFTAWLFVVLIVNWWTGFRWSAHEVWSIEIFILIIAWAMAHYVSAITLYPPIASGDEHRFEFRGHWFLWAFVAICVTDFLQTWALGALFEPWYYMLFVGHYGLLAIVMIVARNRTLNRWVAWYFLISMLTWMFVVRRFLG